MNTLKHFLFLLYIFLLCFERFNPFGIPDFTLAKGTAVALAAIAVLFYPKNLSLRGIKQFFIPVVLLTAWLILVSEIWIIKGIDSDRFINMSWTLNIFFFLILINELRLNPRYFDSAAFSFFLSVTTLCLLVAFGIGVEFIEGGRLSFMGANSNTIANWCVYGLCFALYFVLQKKEYGSKRFLLLLSIPLFLIVIGLSGSRGAFIMAFVCFAFFAFFSLKKTKNKIFTLLVIGIVGFIIVQEVLDSELLLNRLQYSLDNRSIGVREDLWERTIAIFKEYPIAGVGYSGFEVMFARGTIWDSSHNIYLEFLAMGGVVGFLMFAYFIYQLAKASWITYRKSGDYFSMILLVVVMIEMGKTGGIQQTKVIWLIFALIIAKMLYLKENENHQSNENSLLNR